MRKSITITLAVALAAGLSFTAFVRAGDEDSKKPAASEKKDGGCKDGCCDGDGAKKPDVLGS